MNDEQGRAVSHLAQLDLLCRFDTPTDMQCLRAGVSGKTIIRLYFRVVCLRPTRSATSDWLCAHRDNSVAPTKQPVGPPMRGPTGCNTSNI